MILSFDIGGTKIAYGLVKEGKIFNYQKVFWPKPLTKEKFIQKIIEIISQSKIQSLNFRVITLGVAGQVNFKEGSVILSPNISKKREKVFLKKILEEKFKLPVFLDNDANCFTLGEAIFGKGKKENFIIGLTVGSGIGGGIVIDKKIIRGKDGFAGEFGHLILEIGGRKCLCGRRGCFEAYGSGRAMKEIYFEIFKKDKTTFEIEKDFYEKKPEAVFIVNEIARWLAIGIANLVNILNPDLVILGGGMTRFKSFIEIAFKNIKDWLLVKETKTKFLISELNERATLLGASVLNEKYGLEKKKY